MSVRPLTPRPGEVDEVTLETENLGRRRVKIFNFPADLEMSSCALRVSVFSFCVSPENSLADGHVPPSMPSTDRKHRMSETYLSTPLRENQRRRQCGAPAIAPVSARQPASTPKSVWEQLVIGNGTGRFCAPSASANCQSEKGEEPEVFEERPHGDCEAIVLSVRSSSSEMSDRPRSNSDIESRDGGMEESEDDEENERGNMNMD